MRFSIVVLFVLSLIFTAPLVAASEKILVVGDSLSAAYGIPKEKGWVALLQQRLQEEAYDFQVINASITGDTTRGGLARLSKRLQREEPNIVILELGGNDGLRAMSLRQMKKNLGAMIELSRDHDARVLLLGVMIPNNYGKAYANQFHKVYLDLADETEVALVPFFLENVAETRDLMQNDGIHPNEEAQPIILDNVWEGLKPLLD